MIDVHVRFFDLDAVAVDDSVLSDRERERVARKATATLKQRQAASFQCLRVTLGEVLGTSPRALAFDVKDSGKPVFAGGGLHFNVSHSGGVGMLAWGPRELGADLQALIARPSDGLATKVLSARELATWRTMPEADQRTGLTVAWARKESTLKAIGSGLRIPPRTIEVMPLDADWAALVHMEAGWSVNAASRRWHGIDWTDGVPEGHRAAVCVEAP